MFLDWIHLPLSIPLHYTICLSEPTIPSDSTQQLYRQYTYIETLYRQYTYIETLCRQYTYIETLYRQYTYIEPVLSNYIDNILI